MPGAAAKSTKWALYRRLNRKNMAVCVLSEKMRSNFKGSRQFDCDLPEIAEKRVEFDKIGPQERGGPMAAKHWNWRLWAGFGLSIVALVAYGFFVNETRAVFWPALLLRSEEHTSELQSPCNLVCR